MNSPDFEQAVLKLNAVDISWTAAVFNKLRGVFDEKNKFANDPVAYIAETGYQLPSGYQVHFIDEVGRHYPEDVTFLQPTVGDSRIDVRIDHEEAVLIIRLYPESGT